MIFTKMVNHNFILVIQDLLALAKDLFRCCFGVLAEVLLADQEMASKSLVCVGDVAQVFADLNDLKLDAVDFLGLFRLRECRVSRSGVGDGHGPGKERG